MAKRHQITILTSLPGKCWASCSTCGRQSKQGSVKQAEAWQAKHQDEALSGASKGRKS